MKKPLFLLILFLLSSILSPTVLAGPLNDKAAYQTQIKNLDLLLKSLNQVSEKISRLQETLQSSDGVGREQELRSQINDLSQKRKDMEDTFIQLATGVDLRVYQKEKKEEFDWNLELTELLGPVIRELKKATSRPREIEKLRSRIELYRSQLPVTEKAIENVGLILPRATDPALIEKLNRVKKLWIDRNQEITTQMSVAVHQLEEKIAEKKPLSESLRGIARIFLKSRGRNLILAFFAFALTWFLLHWIHKLIQRHSRFHKRERSFYVRIFDMAFIFLNALFAIVAFLAALYLFGDWVLLAVAIIFIIGIAWASKQAIPLFWNQAKLIMNLGPVREGERVIYNDIPYEVKSINLYTEFQNKDLEGGSIRLPIKDLLDLRSRSASENEPWFPTRSGDWVVLNDDTHGKVVVQTPEIVKLKLLGGAAITYKTPDYVARTPMNLSSGFRLWIVFGIDYAHQAIITRKIPALLETAIIDELTAEGHGELINSIQVQFKEAGPSSLDVAILADFKGDAGSEYKHLNRTIQRICVDMCNRHHWVIPFQQVTVHMAKPKDE